MKKMHVSLGRECVLLGIGWLLLMAAPAHAVVGNVSIISAGEPVAGVTISLQTPDGQVVAEDESDDDGRAAIYIPDSHRGKKLILIATRDDRTARQTVDVGDNDTLTIVVRLPRAGTGPQTTPDGLDVAIVITGLYKWADFDGTHNYVTGGLSARGNLDDGGAGIGLDLQVRPPSLSVGGRPVFFVVGTGWPCGISATDVWADYHPPGGSAESRMKYWERWFARPMVACDVLDVGRGRVTVMGGVQITGVEVRFLTDESGGGGVLNRFQTSDTVIGPVLGVGFTHPLANTAMELVGNWYLSWLGDVHGSGRSTLGFDYNYRLNGGIQTEFQIGLRIPLGR
jgi:hypothetical protein